MRRSRLILLVILMLACLCQLGAQSPDWLWAVSARGNVHESANAVATDVHGNIYITGYMEWTIAFDDINLTGYGNDDVFVAMLNPAGNWLMATHAGGTGEDGGSGIAVCPDGDIIICGSFEGVATFGTFALVATTNNYPDGFVAKLDPDGNWLWAVQIPCTGYAAVSDIALDGAGNCFVTGTFLNNATFGAQTLASAGSGDIFAAKLDADGNWLWARRAGGTEADQGLGVATDSAGNALICGNFHQTAAFGEYPLTSLGGYDIFAAKLNPDGTWLWAVRAGGPNTSDFIPDKATAIAVDSANNAYITGNFQEYACFGTTCFSSGGPSNADAYVAKLDPLGNWLWAAQAAGTSTDSAYGICLDPYGQISLTGCFYETISFFGPGSLTSLGYTDVFVAQLDIQGNWLRAWRAGGTYVDSGNGINSSASGNIYLAGHFMGTADFGGNGLTSLVGNDIFVARIGSFSSNPDAPIPPVQGFAELKCGPNPFAGCANITCDMGESRADCEIAVYDLRGRKLATLHQGNLVVGSHEFVWNPQPNLPAGIYLCRMVSGTDSVVLRLILMP